MLSVAEVLRKAERKWPALLRAEAAGISLFPWRLPFGRPATSADLTTVRKDAEALASEANGWRIEREDVSTRKWGKQRWPTGLVFDSVEDVAKALGRRAELERVRVALREARAACPALEPWLRANAHRIPEHASCWADLLRVCQYFDANPRPGCYARQVPVSADTKFIERNEGILWELLDATLGGRANQDAASFAERFHLRGDPPQVTFRFLDQTLQTRLGWPIPECTVPAPIFAALEWTVPRVLVVENRAVFLCIPAIPDTIAVWGAGKAASLLTACRWMTRTELVYWGDCDEAGFGILGTLRRAFPSVRSALMDEAAWSRWSHLAVDGSRDSSRSYEYLTPTEVAVLRAVIAGPWMLEQERIPTEEAHQAILGACASKQ